MSIPISSPESSIFICFSTSLYSISISTFISIALNTSLKNSTAFSCMSSFFLTRITACLLNNPSIPELPSSTTSYSILSLVVCNSTNAFVIASSTVFAENSLQSDIFSSVSITANANSAIIFYPYYYHHEPAYLHMQLYYLFYNFYFRHC